MKYDGLTWVGLDATKFLGATDHDERGRFTGPGSGGGGNAPSAEVTRAVKNYTAKGGAESKRNPASPQDKAAMESWLKTGSESGPVYRGMGFSEKQWTAEFEQWTTPGSEVQLPSVTSCTRDHDRIGSYASGAYAAYLTIEGHLTGRDVSGLSVYPEEQEVLLAPGKITIISASPRPNTNGSSWDIRAKQS